MVPEKRLAQYWRHARAPVRSLPKGILTMLTPEQVCAHEGRTLLSVAQFTARFAALGYRLDRSMDCRAPARIVAPRELEEAA